MKKEEMKAIKKEIANLRPTMFQTNEKPSEIVNGSLLKVKFGSNLGVTKLGLSQVFLHFGNPIYIDLKNAKTKSEAIIRFASETNLKAFLAKAAKKSEAAAIPAN